ncbi:MAG: FtsK/SpoIIIE domain-containing protein [Anaerolineae bacterium]
MQRLLELQANQIEQVLWRNNIAAQVIGGDVLPRLTTFHLTVSNDQGDVLARVQRLASTLALRLDVSGEVRIARHGAKIVIQVPHGQFRPMYLLRLQQEVEAAAQPVPTQTMLLGLDEDGRPLFLNLTAPDVAHALVAGTTGSGKSSLMLAMALSLAINNRPDRTRLVLIDPKGRQFSTLAGLPHLLAGVVTGVDSASRAAGALAVMEKLLLEMERRDRAGVSLPHIFVFIDELADLMLVGGPPFRAALTRLTQRGRGAGIHVVAGTQKPTVEVIGSLVKANFPTRIVGAVASPEDAKVAAGVRDTGAETLAGKGDFLLIAGGLKIRFQAGYVPPEAIPQVVAHLAAGEASPAGRRWDITSGEPAETTTLGGRLRKLIPFPLVGQRGGHNRSDPPQAVADAQAGMSAWQLRLKYGFGGSKAERLVREYGPKATG